MKSNIMTKLVYAADEIKTLVTDKVKPILGKDCIAEFLLLEKLGKNNSRRSRYG